MKKGNMEGAKIYAEVLFINFQQLLENEILKFSECNKREESSPEFLETRISFGCSRVSIRNCYPHARRKPYASNLYEQ